MHHRSDNPSSSRSTCKTTRLAESGCVAVDSCDCGMLQLHVGALTLRLAACAAHELLATLGEALAARELELETPEEIGLFAHGPRKLGSA
jgi:hypothetical protein